MRVRVLVVDDEEVINRILKRGLSHDHADWEIETESNSGAALSRLLGEETWDVIFLDIIMPHLNGMALFKSIEKAAPHIVKHVVFITGAVLDPAVIAFRETVPNKFIEKPFSFVELEDAIIEMVGTQK